MKPLEGVGVHIRGKNTCVSAGYRIIFIFCQS